MKIPKKIVLLSFFLTTFASNSYATLNPRDTDTMQGTLQNGKAVEMTKSSLASFDSFHNEAEGIITMIEIVSKLHLAIEIIEKVIIPLAADPELAPVVIEGEAILKEAELAFSAIVFGADLFKEELNRVNVKLSKLIPEIQKRNKILEKRNSYFTKLTNNISTLRNCLKRAKSTVGTPLREQKINMLLSPLVKNLKIATEELKAYNQSFVPYNDLAEALSKISTKSHKVLYQIGKVADELKKAKENTEQLDRELDKKITITLPSVSFKKYPHISKFKFTFHTRTLVNGPSDISTKIAKLYGKALGEELKLMGLGKLSKLIYKKFKKEAKKLSKYLVFKLTKLNKKDFDNLAAIMKESANKFKTNNPLGNINVEIGSNLNAQQRCIEILK